MMTKYLIIILLFLFSCNPLKENIAGNYTYEINQNRNHIWQSYKLKIMMPDSFYLKNKYGSLGDVSYGKWYVNDEKVILNSTYQINDEYFETQEYFLKSNERDSITTFNIGYGCEELLEPFFNTEIYINSNHENLIKPDTYGFAKYKMSNIENITIYFERYDKTYVYKPLNNNSNDYSIIFKLFDFHDYLILDNFELNIKTKKLTSNSKWKLKYKKQ